MSLSFHLTSCYNLQYTQVRSAHIVFFPCTRPVLKLKLHTNSKVLIATSRQLQMSVRQKGRPYQQTVHKHIYIQDYLCNN